MILNTERGRRVPVRPGLDRYDNMKPRPEADTVVPSEVIVVQYGDSLRFQKEIPSNRLAAYRELVALGVNGEVPYEAAVANTGLLHIGSSGGPSGRGERYATRAANDNEQSRMAA